MQHQTGSGRHSVLAPGERASSLPTITSAACTVLDRFHRGNLAEFNSDENVFFSQSNMGETDAKIDTGRTGQEVAADGEDRGTMVP